MPLHPYQVEALKALMDPKVKRLGFKPPRSHAGRLAGYARPGKIVDLMVTVDASAAVQAFRDLHPMVARFWLEAETKIMERRVRLLYERFL